MPPIVEQDFTFMTNNARDFRKLYAKEELHAGLVIIVPQVLPVLQRELFALILQDLAGAQDMVNEVIEVTLAGEDAVLTRYSLPEAWSRPPPPTSLTNFRLLILTFG
ncbi:hypothetical protein [Rhizobium sp. Pop5]|uniref:hypothetical protein n=1 Tax=Rhizobium sp. Pop5 TaxID=1223565 RepID=UPI0002837C36|nr:hypothetical protein [Rhizobium sp. Pop5]EJZ22750.1 hypothetical protein RCCGEPOP_03166 [Rhizobium sp. Pop5]